MKNKYLAVIIIVVLGALLVWWFLSSGNEATAPTDSDNQSVEVLPLDDPNQPIPEGSATNQLPNTDGLAVLAQQAGDYVTVDNYVLSKTGFVVIHSTNADGSAGAIVGQSGALNAGRGQDLEINASIEAGKTYVAMLHYDNGDRRFIAAQDEAATSEGNPIMTSFRVE